VLKELKKIILITFLLFVPFFKGYTQDMSPARVGVSEVSSGMIAPNIEFIGTVYYQEVSEVASEVSGKVEMVAFEEGQRVKEGQVLLKLSSDLLKKTLQSTMASYEEVLSELEKARREFERAESLFEEKLISEQSYDGYRFRVKGLEKRADSLRAEVERLEVELQKKVIKAPFDGIVIKKHISRGEWLSPGSIVAIIARDEFVDVVVEVPERIIRFIKPDMKVTVKAGGNVIMGRVFAIIAKADMATRTIPIKIRIKNTSRLMEGMEARVSLPSDKKRKALTVPRDALISVFGRTIIFTVIDSQAKMIPVRVIGYKGMTAGIYAKGLQEGMKVVVKGNERLRDGQPVEVISKK
jgi:RND family efflux transporter MFP subunit